MTQKIIDWMSRKNYKAANVFQLRRDLNIKDPRGFDRALDRLVEGGDVVKNKEGQYQLAIKAGYVKGIIDIKASGYGFLNVEDREDDIYVHRTKIRDAFPGDLCLAKVYMNRQLGKTEAEIVKIIERAQKEVIGEYYQGAIFPRSPEENRFYKVSKRPSSVSDHSIVRAKIVKWGRNNILEVEVLEILGQLTDPGIEMIEVISRLGIPHEFSSEVLHAAQVLGDRVKDEDLQDRRDLRDEIIFTIDGEDTKDIDDAISIKRLKDGQYRLGVHIADVSYYVQEGGLLDQEALARGTSVYLADRVIPMLPKALSNGICSLNPCVDRLSVTCEMDINLQGEVTRYDIYPSVIHSRMQLTYPQVNRLLQGEKVPSITEPKVIESLEAMAELAKILTLIRTQIDSINFETIEPKIIFDEAGDVTNILIRERGESERIIEEFMLVANQVVATDISGRGYPFIYRIHEKPDPEKLKHVFLLAKELNYVTTIPKKIKPKDLQMLLDAVENTSYDKVINLMMLQSMAKAIYSETNVGHYGLAFPEYTHFTSPIRRYPDLIVHRMLREYLFSQNPQAATHFFGILPQVAVETSKAERRAMMAEREVTDMKKAEFMEKKIGEEFIGVIASITRFGMFVELANTVEGLIHISTFPEAIEFNEEKMYYLGISSRTMYTIGKEVRVKLVKVNRLQGKIDLILAEGANPSEGPRI